MTFQELLARSIQVQNRLQAMAKCFPWENREAYLSWLAQTYEYASRSTRILALTAGHFPLDKTAFSNRFIQHAAEEKGHDRLLENDAKALGVSMGNISVLPEAEAFHKSLYYWIYQGRPSVIFGWILCLECFAVQNGPAVYERAQKAFGQKATTFVRVHAMEDPDHIKKAFSAVEKLSEKDLDDVCHGLELYAGLYESVYQAIEKSCEATESKNRVA
jgi:pyrroloquinoline quinone (PQQ) biosynthesis protein C